jgi:hypothetical protein
MALNFKNYERAERVSLGTIATLAGAGGKIKPVSIANFADDSKRVVILITQKSGESDTVTCSPEVSKRLRSKELKISQLATFEVIEQLTQSGEIMNLVIMPTGASSIPDYEITGKEEAFSPVTTFNVEELIAF